MICSPPTKAIFIFLKTHQEQLAFMPSEPGTIPNFYTVKIIKHIPQAKKDMRYGTSLQKAICKLEITNLLKDTVVLLLSWVGLGLQLGPG